MARRLTNVAGPGEGLQQADGIRGEGPDVPVETGLEQLQKVQGEGQDVLLPLAQRRDAQGHHIDAVEEVFPEAVVAHGIHQSAIAGADQAKVAVAQGRAAKPLEAALLEDPQEAGLELGAHIGHLVEEEGAAVGLLQIARRGLGRPGKGPLLVAKQGAFEQLLGQGATVDLEEGLRGPQAASVQDPRDHLLAGAALALQQDRGVQRRDLADLLQQPLDGRRAADQDLTLGAPVQYVSQAVDLAIGTIQFQRLGDGRLQGFEVLEGLGQVIEEARAHRPHRIAHIGIAGDQDGDLVRSLPAHFLDQVQTATIRQPLIHQDQVVIAGARALSGTGGIDGHVQRHGAATKPLRATLKTLPGRWIN